MTSNEKLDAVLTCLNETYDRAHKITTVHHENGSISNHFSYPAMDSLDYMGLTTMMTFVKGIDSTELELVLDFLVNEPKYVELVKPANQDSPNEYRIRYKGKVFLANGGYTGEFNRRNDENNRVEALERNQKVNANRMTYLTIILAAFAFLSVFLQCLEKFDVVFRIHIWVAFFVYLSGILTGITILLIVKEVLNRKNIQ